MMMSFLFWTLVIFTCVVVVLHAVQAALASDKEHSMGIYEAAGFWKWMGFLMAGKHDTYPLWWIYTLVTLVFCLINFSA